MSRIQGKWEIKGKQEKQGNRENREKLGHYGTYRFKYNAFIRDEDMDVFKKTFYSAEFIIEKDEE